MSNEAGATPNLDDHAEGLLDWVAQVAGGEVLRAERHAGGSHRIAWQVDVAGGGDPPRALFLTLDAPDAGGEGGNVRDGAVLSALGETPIPVPRVVGRSGPGGALLMERVAGRSDAPAGAALAPVMAALMFWISALTLRCLVQIQIRYSLRFWAQELTIPTSIHALPGIQNR